MAQDHSFKVSNSRTGKLLLETDSYLEAAAAQYRANVDERAEGYQPMVRLWLVDVDGAECIVQTQL